MDQRGFFILAILTTILVQVKSDRNVLNSTNIPTSADSVSGFALEMILSKHESVEHQLREDVQEQRKANVKNQEKLIQTLELLTKMQQDMQLKMQQTHTEYQKAMKELKSTLSTQGLEVKNKQDETGNHISQLERDQKELRNTMLDLLHDSYRSCRDAPSNVSGKYKIRLNGKINSFEAYCEQLLGSGGWMIIQWRKDGSQNFNRNWDYYRNGFGEVDREHWLGLERIHQHTKEHDCEMLIELVDFSNTHKYARYDSFAIGSEAEGYHLKTLGSYKGTAGDSLRKHVGMKFSTPERDNDKSTSNCAESYKSGWWFNSCGYVFLNGLYRNAKGSGKNDIAWYGFNEDSRGLFITRMMIRPN
ncbi:fibrinogen-like protein 1 [Anopheles aquasalis]|uniref:fibrinogen-like protein 1 n=1 Tax=Anopheles aquasalis TaxID=42839 RepID=UPI00215A89A1|nr:fibrinogen-like protein 1 [Anopheles aquasalis]